VARWVCEVVDSNLVIGAFEWADPREWVKEGKKAVEWTAGAVSDAWEWVEKNVPGAKEFVAVFPPAIAVRIALNDPIGTAAKLAAVAATGGAAAPVFLPDLLADPGVQSLIRGSGLSKEEAAAAMQSPEFDAILTQTLAGDPQVQAILNDPAFQQALDNPELLSRYAPLAPTGDLLFSPDAVFGERVSTEVKKVMSPPIFTESEARTMKSNIVTALLKHMPNSRDKVPYTRPDGQVVKVTRAEKKWLEEMRAHGWRGADTYESAVASIYEREVKPQTGTTLDQKVASWVRNGFTVPRPPVLSVPVRTRPGTTEEEQLEIRFEANAANAESGALPLPAGPGAQGIVVSPAGIEFGNWQKGSSGGVSGILVNPLGIEFANWQKLYG